MIRTWLLAVPFALALTAPALALDCSDRPDSGVHFGFGGGFHIGEPYTEEEQAVFDQMALRRQGIDATRVERWNGCLRAWVKGEDGRQHQQFFDPSSYDRLDLTFRP